MENNRDSRYKRFFEIAFREVKRVLQTYSGKFSKKTYTQHQHAVAILLMKYENKPYRDIIDLLKEMWAYFKFKGSVPHYTTLHKFFSRIPSGIWEFLLTKTYQLFDVRIANIAIDSTGFSERHTSRYYYTKFGEEHSRKQFMKHSLSVDTDNQAVITSINRQSRRHDNIYFIPLVEKSRNIVELGNVTADKGYDAEKNHEYVRETAGGMSIIPLRPLKWVGTTKGKYRQLLNKHFPEREYHQRSKIETVNFVEKIKFGDELRSKLLRMQRRELKVIDIVYNIYRYMKLNVSVLLGFLQG